MKSILDKEFRYTPAAATDLRKTFARIRRERAQRDAENRAETARKVAPIARRKS